MVLLPGILHKLLVKLPAKAIEHRGIGVKSESAIGLFLLFKNLFYLRTIANGSGTCCWYNGYLSHLNFDFGTWIKCRQKLHQPIDSELFNVVVKDLAH